MKPLRQPAIAAVAAVAAIAILFPAHRVNAFNPQPDPPAFGMIGVDMTQAIRLNAVCADGPLPGGAAPGPCDVTLAFDDVNDHMLAQSIVTLQPGQGASLDLRGADLVRLMGPHGPFRVEVQPCIKPVGRGFVLVTAEVFEEATGRTVAVLNPTEPRSLGSPSAGQ